MDTSQMIKMVVGTVVVFLVVVAIAIPIISDMHITTETENPGATSIRMGIVDGEHTVTSSSSGPYIIDGAECDIDGGDAYYLFLGPNLSIYTHYNNGISIRYYSGETPLEGSSIYYGTVTITMQSVSFDPAFNGHDSIQYSGTAISVDPDGPLAKFDGVDSVTVASDDTVYYTMIGGSLGFVAFTGSTTGDFSSFTFVKSTTQIEPSEDIEYVNLSSSADFTDNGDGTVSYGVSGPVNIRIPGVGGASIESQTLSDIIAPVTYSTTSGPDKTLDSMIQLVPLLMVVGMLIAVTAAFISWRSS